MDFQALENLRALLASLPERSIADVKATEKKRTSFRCLACDSLIQYYHEGNQEPDTDTTVCNKCLLRERHLDIFLRNISFYQRTDLNMLRAQALVKNGKRHYGRKLGMMCVAKRVFTPLFVQ